MVKQKFILKSAKDFGDLKNYITKQNDIVKILKGVKFTISLKNVDYTQYNYRVTITHNKIRRTFKYFEGKGHEKLNEKNVNTKSINALWCLLMETTDYNELDYNEFCNCFGYDIYDTKTKKIYNACKINSEKMNSLFTNNEINTMQQNINL